MEPGELVIEEIIKKWEGHQPAAEKKSSEEQWYHQPVSEYANVTRRRRERRRVKQPVTDYMKDSHLWQKRFRVIPTDIKIDIQHYQISQCNKCQDLLKYYPTDSKASVNSQTKSLFEYAAGKRSLTNWHGGRYFKSILLAACYQSKDEMLLKQINQKAQPVILIHDERDLLSCLLLYLFCATFGKKVPYIIMREEDVTSPILKYLMEKLGFIFVGSVKDDIQSAAETVIKLLKSNNHVVLGLKDREEIEGDKDGFAPPGSIFKDVLCGLRKDDKLLKSVLLLPISLSMEKGYSVCTKLSITGVLREWFYFPQLARGLAQFNISRSVKLHSVMNVAAEMNPQDSCVEEDNLIQRHIANGLLETCAFLPTHLVSFLLLTKYRSCVHRDDLLHSLEWLLNELDSMDRFLGFSGEIKDIIDHALGILQLQNVIEYNTETKMILPRINDISCANKLFENAKKVINVFMMKAVVASSIVACVGGNVQLREGSGYNVKCAGDKILQKADYLGDILSFLFDFGCPLNGLSDGLVGSLEKLVTMDVLSTNSDNYESQSHQKLVHSVEVNSGWDDEAYAPTEIENEVIYDVSVEDDIVELLNFLHSCITPFIEIAFIVLVQIREYGEGIEFTITNIYDDLIKRFDNGLFPYAEVLVPDFISRVLDYLYEKEVVDENEAENAFTLSGSFIPGKGELEKLLVEIALFR